MEDGDVCNLSTLFMCAHNGTHTDAPEIRQFVGMQKIGQSIAQHALHLLDKSLGKVTHGTHLAVIRSDIDRETPGHGKRLPY